MASSAGSSVRMTKGTAMIACAAGIRTGEVRRSSGGSSRAIRNPRPTVTALTPRGSMSDESATPRVPTAEAVEPDGS